MTPTPEQVAAWAREAGLHIPYWNDDSNSLTDPPSGWAMCGPVGKPLERFAALVDAHRAEQDARFADCYENNSLAARSIAAAIRATIKK